MPSAWSYCCAFLPSKAMAQRGRLRVWMQERDNTRRLWVQDTLFVASAPSALSRSGVFAPTPSTRLLAHRMFSRRLPIHEAAKYWDVDMIQEQISKGVNPDALDEPGGRTPLFFACCEESNFTAALSNDEGHADAQVACALALLKSGASPRAADVYGLGPVHCAAACRRAGARLVELLITYGANPNQATGGGRTALHAAAHHGHADAVHVLLHAGADANYRGRYGSALDLANCPPKITARVHRTRCRRVLPYLLRAGATLPKESEFEYLQKVMERGSFAAFERTHLESLTAVFVPKFPGLPEELVGLVVTYWAHVGFY